MQNEILKGSLGPCRSAPIVSGIYKTNVPLAKVFPTQTLMQNEIMNGHLCLADLPRLYRGFIKQIVTTGASVPNANFNAKRNIEGITWALQICPDCIGEL